MNFLWKSMGVMLLAGAMALVSCGDVGDAPEAATDTTQAEVDAQAAGAVYTIDTAQSTMAWKAAKVTNAHDGGFQNYNGTVRVEDGTPTYADVTIDVASIWSDSEKLTGHLKSDDFFLVEEYPTARFEASSFTPIDTMANGYMVNGNLTLRGTTNSITFPATITSDGNSVAINGDFIINRQNWGINYTGAPDDLIEDNVRLILDVVAVPDGAVTAAAEG